MVRSDRHKPVAGCMACWCSSMVAALLLLQGLGFAYGSRSIVRALDNHMACTKAWSVFS